MTRTRALGIIRLSKSPDPTSTSITFQRGAIEDYTRHEGMELIDVAIDKATSAFHIPPEKRKQFKEWLARPDDFDCIVFYRQDRLVRRAIDFMGLVTWCQGHGKALYSATEGTGDVSQHAGMLIGFLRAWQAEGESQSSSDRAKSREAQLAKEGRWRGGRIPYGAKAVQKVAKPGWELVPALDTDEYEHCREAVKRVISGESINGVSADFNRRGVPSKGGGIWSRAALRQILVSRTLLDVGIVNSDEWSLLQTAIKARSINRTVRTTTVAPLHDIVYCGKCGSKIYRWHRKADGKYFGRCRNEIKRADVAEPCNMPMIPYDKLQDMVSVEVWTHKDELVKERVTDGMRRVCLDDIARELLDLLPEYTTHMIDRDEFIRRQTELMDEQESLEHHEAAGPHWQETGETVGDKWERLNENERRIWLLRIGTTYKVYRVGKAWRIRGIWQSYEPGGKDKVTSA